MFPSHDIPVVKKITDGELQKYMSAKYLVDVEKGTKMLIDDIYTGREKKIYGREKQIL